MFTENFHSIIAKTGIIVEILQAIMLTRKHWRSKEISISAAKHSKRGDNGFVCLSVCTSPVITVLHCKFYNVISKVPTKSAEYY